jgi:ribosome maturation factor RimP
MQIAERESVQLYDVELVGSAHGKVLRVYIDKEGGAAISDCENVSKGLNLLLDNSDLIPGAYDLEVSTPGLERVLKKPKHFLTAIGKKVQFRLRKPLNTFGAQDKKWVLAKQFAAVIESCSDEAVTIDGGAEKVTVPLTEIDRANVVFEIVKNKPGAKKKN